MKTLFKDFFKMSISTSIIFMLFGILLFFNPEGLIVMISEIAGFFFILFGVIKLTYYFRDELHYSLNLIIGLFLTTIGIILVANTNIIAVIIPILIGSSMLALGVQKIDLAMNIKDSSNDWIYILITGFLTLICAILLIINPIKGAFIATKAIGLIIIIYSAIDIIDAIIIRKRLKDVNKVIDVL